MQRKRGGLVSIGEVFSDLGGGPVWKWQRRNRQKFGRLLGRVSIADYLRPASAGVGIKGRARELNAALKVPATGPAGGDGAGLDRAAAREVSG